MGMEYTAEVFWGAFVERDTPLGKRLDKYIDKAGGTPAATEISGVEICMVGSQPSGEIWMVMQASGSCRRFGRHAEVMAPHALTEDPTWRPALAAFFARIKIDPIAIGVALRVLG